MTRRSRIDRHRKPRELLLSIRLHTLRQFWQASDSWGIAAWTAFSLAMIPILISLPPDPPHHNRYYGPPGGLRNPHH